jgi:hypothetical protein
MLLLSVQNAYTDIFNDLAAVDLPLAFSEQVLNTEFLTYLFEYCLSFMSQFTDKEICTAHSVISELHEIESYGSHHANNGNITRGTKINETNSTVFRIFH